MAYRVIRGIGKSRLYAVEARTLLDYTFPLTQLGGYIETWSDALLTHSLTTLDISNPEYSEKQFAIGAWGMWELHWDNFPLPIEPIEMIKDFKNLRMTNRNLKFYFQPKIMANDIYEVNIISVDIKMNNSDSTQAIGNFGVSLAVRTVKTQPIHFTDPNDIPTYSDYEHA